VLVAYASIHVDAAHRVEPSAVFRPHSRSSSLKVLPQTVPTTIGGRPEEALALRGGVANTLPNAFVASIVMALIEKGVKEGLKAANVKFPAQLGGCIFLFSFMMLAEKINPELGNAIFEALSPGAGILAKWLPVFFVPGLALLPLSPKIGTSVDVSFVSGEMLVLALRFRCPGSTREEISHLGLYKLYTDRLPKSLWFAVSDLSTPSPPPLLPS
jgi:hypothetical protein